MKTRKGFTLIELMIVVAIIGLLSAIAAPKFLDMLRKSKEGHTKGSLATLRSAVSMYYSSEEGRYPETPDLLVPKYTETIPLSTLGAYHADASDLLTVAGSSITLAMVTDANGWLYTSVSGAVAVNCSHDDLRQTPIYTW
jgi:general secretion pathway protein G